MKISSKNDVDLWLAEINKRSHFVFEDLPLNRSKDWGYRNGAIRHRSGMFFSIIGVSWLDPAGNKVQQPLIDQRETGILGFIIRNNNDKKELLAYAKLEPGNIGPVQIAPTCQATASNIARAHGGNDPPFAKFFLENKNSAVSDSLQSEHGSRFFGKKNRNIILKARSDIEHGALHKWIRIEEILKQIDRDFLINTDSRSVLVTCPWKELVSWEPFERNYSGFGLDLFNSMRNKSYRESVGTIENKLSGLRSGARSPEIIDINNINGWSFDELSSTPLKGREFSVRHLKIRTDLREVPEWDQPIVESHVTGLIELICGRINGILHFAFRPRTEPGLANNVELGPTAIIKAGKPELNKTAPVQGKTVIESRQSEEGGRFFRDINIYRVVDIGKISDGLNDVYWLSLTDIQDLLLKGDNFTNEARSVLSLLLKWL